MKIEDTLQRIQREVPCMVFSSYPDKSDVPQTLKNIQDTAAKYILLLFDLLNKTPFDFVNAIATGKSLLVGEGNLSFTLSLMMKNGINPKNLVSTTCEPQNDLAKDAIQNAKKIQCLGGSVIFGVDATKLSNVFGQEKFDSVIFQFPHSGSRDPIEGYNPNFILVRDFLKSAACQIMPNGKVLISAVDNPHYRGAFKFEKAGELAGFLPPNIYPFDPSVFHGYTHSMTHQEGSALDNHKTFSTWVFKRKK